jgi:hypothetical protein
MKRLTPPMMRGLRNVAAGEVWNDFSTTGNTFRGPKGTGPVIYRKLQVLRLIEDVEFDTLRPAYSHRQQLTFKGQLAISTGIYPE